MHEAFSYYAAQRQAGNIHLLGADAEERQARQLIAHKRQEQHRNSISKRKGSDPER